MSERDSDSFEMEEVLAEKKLAKDLREVYDDEF